MGTQVLLLFALTLVVTFLVIVTSIILVIHKVVNARLLRERKKVYSRYASTMAELLLVDLPDMPRNAKPSALFKEYEKLIAPIKRELASLTPPIRRMHREALRMVMIDFARDITGESGQRLVYFFYSLEFVEEQIHLMSDRRWWIRAQSARDIGLLKAKKGIAVLTGALEDGHPDVRRQAMESLVVLVGVESLRSIFRISKNISQWMAIELSNLVTRYKDDAIPYLVEGLSSDDKSIVTFCIEMLAEIGFTSAIEPLHRVAELHPIVEVKAKAIEALGRLNDERAEELLITLTRSPFRQIRLSAIEAIGRLGSRAAVRPLIQRMDEGSFQEKLCAARALANCGEEGMQTLTAQSRKSSPLNKSIVEQVMEEKSRTVELRR
ncbi:MAG: HEAT repeat domain-containing protein [Ignavibacteriales bacterium]|nr:HEAT repeat domain-containing protein [Ignavibacteriales bacterium]